MPTINAGATANFSIPAGQVATVNGSGVAVLIYPTSSPIQIVGKGVIGPYEASRVVTMYAQTQLDYTVAPPAVGGVSANLGIQAKPTISTPAVAGQSINASFSAIGNPTPTTAIQWVLDGANITGATANPYVSSSTDAGKSLQVRITATNTYGTLTSISDAVVVGAPPVAEPYWAAESYEVRSAVAANAVRAGMLSSTRTASYIWNPATNTQTMEYALVNQPNVNRNPPSGTYTSLPPGTQDAFTADDAGKQLFVRVASAGTKTLATLTSSGLVATATFAQPHGLSTNDVRAFEGNTPTGYNISNVRITVVDPTTIQYPLLATQAAATVLGYMFLANEVVELTRSEPK